MGLLRRTTSDGMELFGLIFVGGIIAPLLVSLVGDDRYGLIIRGIASGLLIVAIVSLIRGTRRFWQMPAADSCRSTAVPLTIAASVVTLMSAPALGLLPGDVPHFDLEETAGGVVTAVVAVNLIALAARDWRRLAHGHRRVAA